MSNHFDDDHDHGFDDEPFGNYPRPRGSDHSEFNRRILLTAVVSLSLVLVLVFALHLYARFILRRQARRRAAIHQLSLTVAHAHAHSTEPPNTGLDPTLIATLPTFLFKRKEPQQKQQQEENHHHRDASMVECAVCLSVLEDEEMVRLLPNCKHTFHVGCIDTWLASHSTCPVCRTKVEPRLEPQPREGPTGLALHGGEAPSAPLLFEPPTEGTSDSTIAGSPKMNSRLTSFRRILTRERSSRRIQPSSCDNIDQDLERQ